MAKRLIAPVTLAGQQFARTGKIFVLGSIAAVLSVCPALSQSLKVVPVNIHIASGQRAATLSVTNDGTAETAIQVRTYVWTQVNEDDKLTTSDEVLASPPMATIAPGATQVVRLVVRRPPEAREATYRILVDQIPSEARSGMVQIVLCMSIPIFLQPPSRAVSHMQFHVERKAGQIYLVGLNDGLRHEVIRSIVLSTSDGRKLTTESRTSPYVLAGVTRRWHITERDPLPGPTESLLLTASSDAGTINQQVRVVEVP